MKIVHIVMSMLYGGAERLATDLAFSMQNSGNKVCIIALSGKHPEKGYDKTEKGKKIKIYYIDKKQGFDCKAILELNALLDRLSPDVIHTHIDSAIYVLYWELFHKNVIKVHTVHNQADKEFGLIKRRIMKISYSLCGVVPVAISDRIQTSIINEYNLTAEKVPVIYNGIDFDRFQSKRKISKSTELQILHVGRFFPQKNHEFMLRAIKVLRDKKINFHMTFVGEGPLFNETKEIAKELGISQYITFAGSTNFVSDYYYLADVFILPSVFEGLPLSILEAYAAGLPVIANDVGGVTDIFKDGFNGRLVPLNDMNAFISALIEMQSKSKRKRYGEYNLGYVKSFDINAVAQRYLKLYHTLAKRRERLD